jgi:hypothetical protein
MSWNESGPFLGILRESLISTQLPQAFHTKWQGAGLFVNRTTVAAYSSGNTGMRFHLLLRHSISIFVIEEIGTFPLIIKTGSHCQATRLFELSCDANY